MSTVVDLVNLALSKLGDRATVTSISPPEGSAQADHAARWYPIARDVALEEFPQNFSTTREVLTPTDNPSGSWAYAYFKPNNCINMLRLVPNATDATPGAIFSDTQLSANLPYEVETDANGREIILTDEPNAVLLFTTRVVDPGRFSALFADALVFLLASYLRAGAQGQDRGGRSQGQLQCVHGFDRQGCGQECEPDQPQARVRAAGYGGTGRCLRAQPACGVLMGDFTTFNRSFAGGEVTQEFYGQIADSKFQTGLALCRNFMVMPHGPIANRPGTRFVREVKDSSKQTLLIEFTFSFEQALVIEFGESYFRFHALGQTILSGPTPYEFHTYTESQLRDVQHVQSGDAVTLVHPEHPVREPASRRGELTLTDVVTGRCLVAAGWSGRCGDRCHPRHFDTVYVVTALNTTGDELRSAEVMSATIVDDDAYNT